MKVYVLTERMEELQRDRDRVQLALEQTEAAMIGYRERAQQRGQRSGANPDQVRLYQI